MVGDGVWASDDARKTAEAAIVAEAKDVLAAPEMDRIRQAARDGTSVTVDVGGRTIQYEPDLPASGMTMFGADGFIIGPEAFDENKLNELEKTVLHELHRLHTSEAAGGMSGELARRETEAAQEFADRMLDEVKDEP